MTDKTLAPFTPIPHYEVKEIDIRGYLFVILKRRRIILALSIFVFIVGAIYTFFQSPLYRSATRINIDTSTYTAIPEVVSRKNAMDIFGETQMELLQSRALAGRVQKKMGLSPQDVVAPKERNEVENQFRRRSTEDRQNYVIDQLKQMLIVTEVPKTTVFEIAFLTPDPKMSKGLADTWAREYIEYSLASQYEYSTQAEELLTGQIKQLQREISEKQKLLQDYSLQQQVILLENARSLNSRNLEDLNSALTQATNEKISRGVEYRDLQIHGMDAVPEIRTSPVIERLKSEYAKLDQEYSEKSGRYMPDFPVMQNLKRQMEQIQKSMDEEASDLYAKVIANAKAAYEDAKKKEAALKNEVDRAKGETIQSKKDEFGYDQLKAEVDERRKHLEVLLEKQSQAKASAQANEMKATTIRIIEDARLSKSPYKPNILYNLAFSLVLGLMLGIGLGFFVDYLDRSIKNVEDIERHIQLPLLGIIPKRQVIGEGDGKLMALVKRESIPAVVDDSADLVTLSTPDSQESEAFKTIRAGLLVSFPEGPPRSILVTSGQSGEGKTFVASNLAIALAQLDKKVVLVDADLRNPRVHRIWKLNNDNGLSRFLTSTISATEVIRSSPFNGISLITSGAKTPRPTELLFSKRFDELLKQLQTEFDHIIIDSPPVLAVSDALVLASKCNCVVFVVRAGVTPREVVQSAKERLAHFDATMAGVILNAIDPTDPSYYYSYLSNYNQYYGKNE